MSSWTNPLRAWLKPASTRPTRSRLRLESLEGRDNPSISISGAIPQWQQAGPVAIQDGSNVDLGSAAQNVQIGAIEQIALDPFNNGRAAIAAVNGGVWTTPNVTVANPVWTPTTDFLPSLAISSIAYSPSIPNTLYAGTGSFSAGGLGQNFSAGVSNFGSGGAPVGLYKSLNGGQTWTRIGVDVFTGLRVRNVIPTTLNGGQTVFVATTDSKGANTTGIYRSDNGGQTWTRLSGANGLPNLGVTNMIADAGNPNRFFAAPVGGTGAGVYMLDVTGGNTQWQNINTNLPPAVAAGSRILLATSAAGVNPVYAAVVAPNGIPSGIFRSVPFPNGSGGLTYVWTAIGPGGLPPAVSAGFQGDVHFAITADPTSDRLVYVAGDRRDVPAFVGVVARGDAIADTWTTITDLPANLPPPPAGTVNPLNPVPQPTTAPHPDFRGLVFAGTNTILASTDGGIYAVTNPRAQGTAPVWASLNGNLQISELYVSAQDNQNNTNPLDDVLLAAAQDNGSSEAPIGGVWSETISGDGVLVMADSANRYRYYALQFFGFARRNPDGTLVAPAADVIGSGGATISFFQPAPVFEQLGFIPTVTLGQVNTNQVIAGGFRTLYVSQDNGDTFLSVGGVTNGGVVTNLTSGVTSISFGTTQIPFAAYVGTDDGNISQSFDVTSGGGNFRVTNFSSVSGGEVANSIKMDPNNPLIAYAVTNNGAFRTLDGFTWERITDNLLDLTQTGGLNTLYSIDLITRGTVTTADDSLLVGGYGGVFVRSAVATTGGPTNWRQFGAGLPNAVVTTVDYDAQSDAVIAGTYGRGIFRLTGATAALTANPVLVVTGNNSANNMAIWPDFTDPTRFFVNDGVGNQQVFQSSVIQNVQFKGLGGADVIRVGSPDAATPGRTDLLRVNITVDAGSTTGDQLIVDATGSPVALQGTGTAVSLGGGLGDTFFDAGGKLAWTGLNLGAVAVRFSGAAGDKYIIDDSSNATGTTYSLSASRFSRALSSGPIDYTGVESMVVRGGSGVNQYQVTGTGAAATTVADGGSASTFVVQGGGLTGTNTFQGGGGNDVLSLFGRTSDDSLTLTLQNLAGAVAGVGTLGAMNFQTFETLNFDGNGGTDNLTWQDGTNTSIGSPDDPDSGIVYLPGANFSGQIKVARGSVLPVVNFNSLAGGLAISGDGDGSGDRDVLAVYGVSTTGRASAAGETTSANGADTITATDTEISIANRSIGVLRSVVLSQSLAGPTFSTVFVRGGNENGSAGDFVTATPTNLFNLVLDGMAPVGTSPGDRLNVNISGPQSRFATSDPSLGPPQIRIVQESDGAAVGSIGFESSGGAGSSLIVVGTDAGPETRVRAFDAFTNELRFDFVPFPGFGGGASVAAGDVNGDGVTDMIVGAGPGGGPVVLIFDGVTGAQIGGFMAFEETFTGGVNVSSADFDRDGVGDVVVGTGIGGGPRVQVRSGASGAIIRDVFVYESTFRGGVSAATGDVNGDGTPDLVTSAGTGGGPRVVIFDGRNLVQIASFFVFDPNLRTGFFASAGDVTGDGFADVIAGSGAGTPAQVRVFNGRNIQLLSDFIVNDPFDPSNSVPYIPVDGGVRVAATDVDGDQIPDVITGKGAGSGAVVRVYRIGSVNPVTNALQTGLDEIRKFSAFDDSIGSGIFVGGSGT